MAKSNTIQIKLVSSAETGYFYPSPRRTSEHHGKLEMKKYDPRSGSHVVLRNAKIK
jgi:large subunit ribosomal protein L33